MDSTPGKNSKEFYRAQIRKKLDQQDAFLHRQAILTIEDMRRKGTYRGMTRDMTLEEKQVCLEIEMANLGIDPGYSSDSTIRENSPKRTDSPENQKPRSCSSPIIRQRNSRTRKDTDPTRPTSMRLSRPTSPSVYSGVCPGRQTATADVPSPPFVPPHGWDVGEADNGSSPPAVESAMKKENALKNSCNRSCQGDTQTQKRESKSAKRPDLAHNQGSDESDSTYVASTILRKDTTRRNSPRPNIPIRHMSLSEEDFERRCRREGYLPRRMGYREF